jgi:hypothetical protein
MAPTVACGFFLYFSPFRGFISPLINNMKSLGKFNRIKVNNNRKLLPSSSVIYFFHFFNVQCSQFENITTQGFWD